MTRPLVSVVIPVFNGTDFLAAAVRSVLEQTYRPLEPIVVDDGSTDATWDLIRSFGSDVVAVRKPNGGVASALNRGIRESSGRYVAWLSHDDLFLPEKVARQVERMEGSGGWAACYTDYRVIDTAGRVLREIRTPWYPRAEMRRRLFGRMFINGSTMLIDRRVLDRVGPFREDLRFTQDAEMWLRILSVAEIGRVGEVLGLLRTHPGQGSRHRAPHEDEERRMFGAAFARLGPDRPFADAGLEPTEAEARDLVWFGDAVAFGRHWFDVADAAYRQAAEVWPSWRNPARARRCLGARALTAPWRWYRIARHRAGVVRAAVVRRPGR